METYINQKLLSYLAIHRCTDNTDLKVPKIKDKSYLHLVKDLVKEHRNDKR